MREIINLDSYPIDKPNSPEWLALVEKCRADIAQDGMFNLEGFLTEKARLQAVAAVAPRFATEAFTHSRRHNIYFKPSVPDLAPDHPALREFQTTNHTLCADQLGGSPILELYEYPEMAIFLAATMNREKLYTMPDPLARVNVMEYSDGEALNWHFDRSEFTTTLLLQAADIGGDFQFRKELRTATDPNYDGVVKLLDGADPDMETLILSAGTLNVFRGVNTPHRVTKIQGDTARIMTVLSYYEQPDVRFSPSEQIGFYGRELQN
jgi:hypothetical protein